MDLAFISPILNLLTLFAVIINAYLIYKFYKIDKESTDECLKIDDEEKIKNQFGTITKTTTFYEPKKDDSCSHSLSPKNYKQLYELPVEFRLSLNNHEFLEEYYRIKGTPYGFIITKHGFKEQLIDKDYIVRVPDNPTEKDWEVAIIKLNEWVQRKINV